MALQRRLFRNLELQAEIDGHIWVFYLHEIPLAAHTHDCIECWAGEKLLQSVVGGNSEFYTQNSARAHHGWASREGNLSWSSWLSLYFKTADHSHAERETII